MTRKTKSPASLRSGARARESDHAGRLIDPNTTARPVGLQQPQLSREDISDRDNELRPPLSDGDLFIFSPTRAHREALLKAIREVVARGRKEGWLAGDRIEVLGLDPDGQWRRR
jgi:hypothetical protein